MGPLLNLRASPARKGLSETSGHCGKAFTLHSQPGDTAGAFPCLSYSLCFIPHSAGTVTGTKNTEKGKKTSLCYYGSLRVIFRDGIFLEIINKHEQDLC